MATPDQKRKKSIAFVESYEPDGRVLVKLVGELDAASAAGVARKLQNLVEDTDTTVDVARTEFGDLGGVRMLVACSERARLSGRSMTVVNAPPHVERMLEMLERGHYWRPQQVARHSDGAEYEIPTATTPDAE